MVSYAPVEIAGKTYILPQRSVTIQRERSVEFFGQGNLRFPTWGPYETFMNVFTFDRYQEVRGTTVRIQPLPDL